MMMRLFPRGVPVVKRLFDLLVVVVGMVLALPVMGIIALVLRVKAGRSVLFRQKRPGYQGEIFTLYKFRSMRNATGNDGKLLPDSQRTFALGKFLRTSSLDELPELINVLRGEMSLVGPRPLLVQYLERYSAEQMRRHDVLPGITGWAQINGRNALTWEEKFRLDVWYVDHWSVWLDVKILALTVWKVFTREGITPRDQVDVQEFMGNEDIPPEE